MSKLEVNSKQRLNSITTQNQSRSTLQYFANQEKNLHAVFSLQLCSYMIWQPIERASTLPSIPHSPRTNQPTPPQSRDIQSRTKRTPHEEFKPYLTTYQAEIASMPLVRRTGRPTFIDNIAFYTYMGFRSLK